MEHLSREQGVDVSGFGAKLELLENGLEQRERGQNPILTKRLREALQSSTI